MIMRKAIQIILRRVIFALVGLLAVTAFARDLQQAIDKGDLAKVKELVETDPSRLHREIDFHNYPLYVAIEKFKPDIIRYLLEQGAKVNVADQRRGENSVFKIVRVGLGAKDFNAAKEIFTLLVDEHKADIKLRNSSGKTPLFVVATTHTTGAMPRKIALMTLLIERGAHPKGQDKVSRPLLQEIIENQNFNRIRITLKKKPEGKLRHCDVVIETIKLLLENGADVNETDDQNNTVLLRVVKKSTEVMPDEKKIELIKLLIDHGANTRRRNRAGESPQRLVKRGDPLEEAIKHKPSRSTR